MQAFHNDSAVKEKYLSRVQEHRRLDNIRQRVTWENGKGCAIGCTLENYDHKAYEVELGIPEWLARVEDTIFEGLPVERAKFWPEDFLSAVPLGVDLDKIKAPFIIFVLESTLANFDHDKNPAIKKSVNDIISLWRQYPEGPAWSAAESAAAAAAAAWSAAESAAESAAAAAESAAAESAAAESAARSAAYMKFADKLLELLKEAK